MTDPEAKEPEETEEDELSKVNILAVEELLPALQRSLQLVMAIGGRHIASQIPLPLDTIKRLGRREADIIFNERVYTQAAAQTLKEHGLLEEAQQRFVEIATEIQALITNESKVITDNKAISSLMRHLKTKEDRTVN